MRGLFDELIDIAKEIGEEISSEIEKQKKLESPRIPEALKKAKSLLDSKLDENDKKPVQESKITFEKKPVKVKKSNKSIRQKIEDGEDSSFERLKRVVTLRDRVSNLETRQTYIEKMQNNRSKLGDYSAKQDLEDERLAKLEADRKAREESLMRKKEKVSLVNNDTNKEIRDLVTSLKSADRIKSVRKAFIYSEIFNRKGL